MVGSPWKSTRTKPAPKKNSGKVLVRKFFKGTKKIFQDKWLDLPEFKDWLSVGAGVEQAYCLACKVELLAGKSDLRAHSRTKKHTQFMKRFVNGTGIFNESVLLEDPQTSPSKLGKRIVVDTRSDAIVYLTPFEDKDWQDTFGDNAFGTDDVTEELGDTLATTLNKSNAILFPTHTMANLAAALAHCKGRGSSVVMGSESQMCAENSEALTKIGGLVCDVVANQKDGSFSLEDFEMVVGEKDYELPFNRLVCIELAHLHSGGRVPDNRWIEMMKEACTEYGYETHCDGRYLFQAALHHGISVGELAKGFDSVTISLEKCFHAPMGAFLLGSKDFIRRAKRIRHTLGGETHQLGSFSCRNMVDRIDWSYVELTKVNRNAFAIASSLSLLDSNKVMVSPALVQTNVIHIHTDPEEIKAQQLVDRLRMVTPAEMLDLTTPVSILCTCVNESIVRIVLHRHVPTQHVKAISKKINYVVLEFEAGQHDSVHFV